MSENQKDTCPHCGLPLNEEGYDPYKDAPVPSSFALSLDRHDLITFGKYSGYSVGQVLQQNPAYLIWMNLNVDWVTLDNHVLDEASRLKEEQELLRRGMSYDPSPEESP